MAMGRLAGSGASWRLLLAVIATALAATTASAQQRAAFRASVHAAGVPAKAPARIDTPRTRFIIGVERNVPFKVTALTKPNRVLVDLPRMKLDLPSPPGETPVGVVKSFQYGLSAPGRLRVVIDVTGPVVIEQKKIEKSPDGRSHNLVLDIVAATEAAALKVRTAARGPGAAALQPPVPRPAVPRQRRTAAAYKPTIVIDPGHGGHDSGARKFGTLEKDVVLSFSLKLREKLDATKRYRVLMTRKTDVFVPLTRRREFAEHSRAALFIAIHADYTARASARGATIYSLRPSVAETLSRSAKGEADERMLSVKEMAPIKKARELAVADGGALRNILADLARRDIELTKERTDLFARSVIGFMGNSTNLMENPDRKAAFVVLRTAKVPSILLELGYLTNWEDAQQLSSDQWRDKVSASLVTAIHDYFCNDMSSRFNAGAC